MEESDNLIEGKKIDKDSLYTEIASIKKRANYFRASGAVILAIVCGLLAFGGYVFVAANEITIREISSTREADIEAFNLRIEQMQKEREALQNELMLLESKRLELQNNLNKVK